MVRVRFAPSPTGYIHIGNARTALFNYLFARHHGGQFVLRIEDTDPERSRRAYEETLIEDLAWLGIHADEGVVQGGPHGPYRQSERTEIYRGYAARLIAQGLAYRCYCTEEELETMRAAAKAEKRPPHYDNRCRKLSEKDRKERESRGVRPVLRFRIDEPELAIEDLVRGTVSFNLDHMLGDFVIMKQDNMPTFHMAVCVDDGLMGITHVLRGEDHLSNTPRHVLLFKAMGFPVPKFAHMSLTTSPAGGLLSKRDGATSIREYRERGYPASGVVNYLSLLGWSAGSGEEIFTMEELIRQFDLSRMKKASAIFDRAKLDWVSGMHIRRMEKTAYLERAFSFISNYQLLPPGALEKEPDFYEKVLLLFQDNIHAFGELADRFDMLREPEHYADDTWLRQGVSKKVLEAAETILKNLKDDTDDLWSVWTKAIKDMTKAKGKELFMPLRLALTGRVDGPELKTWVMIFGRARCLRRIEKARAYVRGVQKT